ncbi:hypothetical protein C9374_010565 [Naegleria lovaniensis]|uniref:Uncharacterized protein n=1 Tax=Naegleria lovaniensis TaxID=51637 RepID=A0AA88GDJ5_NAELO|nr:uncharacterized protein C9374_010565 [Naegleria lovaniensis]KAG2374546.1 hypothetical protein C9374_010565 [Naegleria lovaniensis]
MSSSSSRTKHQHHNNTSHSLSSYFNDDSTEVNHDGENILFGDDGSILIERPQQQSNQESEYEMDSPPEEDEYHHAHAQHSHRYSNSINRNTSSLSSSKRGTMITNNAKSTNNNQETCSTSSNSARNGEGIMKHFYNPSEDSEDELNNNKVVTKKPTPKIATPHAFENVPHPQQPQPSSKTPSSSSSSQKKQRKTPSSAKTPQEPQPTTFPMYHNPFQFIPFYPPFFSPYGMSQTDAESMKEAMKNNPYRTGFPFMHPNGVIQGNGDADVGQSNETFVTEASSIFFDKDYKFQEQLMSETRELKQIIQSQGETISLILKQMEAMNQKLEAFQMCIPSNTQSEVVAHSGKKSPTTTEMTQHATNSNQHQMSTLSSNTNPLDRSSINSNISSISGTSSNNVRPSVAVTSSSTWKSMTSPKNQPYSPPSMKYSSSNSSNGNLNNSSNFQSNSMMVNGSTVTASNISHHDPHSDNNYQNHVTNERYSPMPTPSKNSLSSKDFQLDKSTTSIRSTTASNMGALNTSTTSSVNFQHNASSISNVSGGALNSSSSSHGRYVNPHTATNSPIIPVSSNKAKTLSTSMLTKVNVSTTGSAQNSGMSQSTNAVPSINVIQPKASPQVVSKSSHLMSTNEAMGMATTTNSSHNIYSRGRSSPVATSNSSKDHMNHLMTSPSKSSTFSSSSRTTSSTNRDHYHHGHHHDNTDSFLQGHTSHLNDSFGLMGDINADLGGEDSFVYNSSYMSSGSSTPPEPFSTEMQKYVKEKILSNSPSKHAHDSKKEDIAKDSDNTFVNSLTLSSKKRKDLSASFSNSSSSFPIKSFSKI